MLTNPGGRSDIASVASRSSTYRSTAATLKFFDVFLIVLSPIIAIFAAHIFSNSLVQQMELRRRPTMREWLALVGSESTLLLLAVPPLAILIVLRLANVALTDAVQLLIWLEALSLIFWAGLAAWHAGLRGATARALHSRRRRGRGDRAPAASVPGTGQGSQRRHRSRPATSDRSKQ